MTDRKLLELAAKAAGIKINAAMQCERDAECTEPLGLWTHTQTNWNPLTDDGDALRLAVKLRLSVDTDYNDGSAVGSADLSMDCFHEYDPPLRFGADRNAATRRAIVRAAAAIGEGMK